MLTVFRRNYRTMNMVHIENEKNEVVQLQNQRGTRSSAEQSSM